MTSPPLHAVGLRAEDTPYKETPMQELAGRVAVITGAGCGIGAAMARRFARARMKIVAADVE